MFIGKWWSARRNSVISHCENGEFYGRQETSLVRSGVTTLASWCWRKLPCTLWEKPLKRLSSLTWWYLRLCVAANDPFLTGGFVQLFIQFIWILHTLQPRLLSIFVSVLFPHSFRTINASTLRSASRMCPMGCCWVVVWTRPWSPQSCRATVRGGNTRGPQRGRSYTLLASGWRAAGEPKEPQGTQGGAGHGREKP